MIQDDIISELKYIPEEKLFELYDLIHYFRLGINSEKQVIQEENKERKAGILQGTLSASFFDPLPEEELRVWE